MYIVHSMLLVQAVKDNFPQFTKAGIKDESVHPDCSEDGSKWLHWPGLINKCFDLCSFTEVRIKGEVENKKNFFLKIFGLLQTGLVW